MMGKPIQDWLVDQTLGKPYSPGGKGPESFDCWGLVQYVYKKAFQTSLKGFVYTPQEFRKHDHKFRMESDSEDWTQLESPVDGCVVAMSRSKIIHHIGVWIDVDGGKCLHALDGQSVIAQSLQQLKRQFTTVLFFQYG